LHGIANACICAVLIDTIHAVYVSKKQRVEAAPLQGLHEIQPEVEIFVPVRRAVRRIAPVSKGLQTDRTVSESVEVDRHENIL
jgi:hypothetical protein